MCIRGVSAVKALFFDFDKRLSIGATVSPPNWIFILSKRSEDTDGQKFALAARRLLRSVNAGYAAGSARLH